MYPWTLSRTAGQKQGGGTCQKDIKGVILTIYRTFNTGAPYNVQAGQGSRGMEELVAHYEKVNYEAQEKIVAAAKARAEK